MNIDNIISELNNDSNIPKDKQNMFKNILLQIYTKSNIKLEKPEDYTNLNQLYIELYNVLEQIEKTGDKSMSLKSDIYKKLIRIIRHFFTLLALYYFIKLSIIFVGISVVSTTFTNTKNFFKYAFGYLSGKMYFYNILKGFISMLFFFYNKFIFEGVLYILNDALRLIFKAFGIGVSKIFSLTPDTKLKKWIYYIYNFLYGTKDNYKIVL